MVVYTLENVLECIAFMVQTDVLTSEPVKYYLLNEINKV